MLLPPLVDSDVDDDDNNCCCDEEERDKLPVCFCCLVGLNEDSLTGGDGGVLTNICCCFKKRL